MSDIDTIRKNFSRYAQSYDNYSNVQNHAGSKLIKTLPQNRFRKIIDIGCGTGGYTQLLRKRFPSAKIKAVDISEPMVSIARSKLRDQKIDFLIADAQKEHFEDRFDLISSNACFQWFDDLQSTLNSYSHLLEPGGAIVFSIFGPGTFCELSESLSRLFQKDITINSQAFIDRDGIKQILQKCFDKISVEQENLKETYVSLQQLLNTIKYTGVRGNGLNGEIMGRNRITELQRIYKQRFKTITATYQIFYCRAANE